MSASVPEVHAIFAQLMEVLGVRLVNGSITFHVADEKFLKFHTETYGRPPRDTRPCRKPPVDDSF